MKKQTRIVAAIAVAIMLMAALVFAAAGVAQTALTPIEALGDTLYFDENLSQPAGQACASCHLPAAGFVDPDAHLPVSEGVIPGLFGGRNSPASAYAMYAPTRYFDEGEGLWIGGQFWDSRATGHDLGDPLADQAIGPFLNPVEMANVDSACVVWKVCTDYGAEFEAVWGSGACSIAWPGDIETVCDEALVELALDAENRAKANAAYNDIGLSIAAFERTSLFAQFNSKYDAYLQACLADGGLPDDCAKGIGKVAKKAGKIFSNEEWHGLQLFMGDNNNDGILAKGEGAMCAACHVADFTPAEGNVIVPAWAPEGMVPPVFTDFTYDNLGVPVNPEIAALIGEPQPIDLGLGPIVGDPAENGKFKVMTLRNIGLTAPYAHNGLFVRLKDITHFYNTRDLLPSCDLVSKPKIGKNCWPASEVPETINVDELGNLGLSDEDEDALVEFMKTLSDGWTP